jgi:hypothetical protein
MARTAVVAGTATAVSNRVSRRQANRWSAQGQQYEDPYASQAYEPPPPPAQPPPAASAETDPLAQLEKLGQLKAAGVLTEAEFNVQKARILGG